MKHVLRLFIVPFFLLYHSLNSEPLIMIFMRPYPGSKEQAQRWVDKLRRPSFLAKRTIEGILARDLTTGIFSTYAGYLQVSNHNGQIIFPRKHSKPSLPVIVTNKITPIIMFDNTISHWELEPSAQAALYTVEIKQNETTQALFWTITQKERPKNNRIPLESLIIIAKPQNIYIPTGITLTNESPHLLLPDMYVKKGINIIRNALYILNLSHFFRPPQMLYKKEANRYATLLQE